LSGKRIDRSGNFGETRASIRHAENAKQLATEGEPCASQLPKLISLNAMKVFVAGLSYKTAPVELRERIAVSPSNLRCSGCRLKIGGGLEEVVLLSTCNRVEVYGVASKINGNVHGLFKHLGPSSQDFGPYLYVREGGDALRHLFSVAGGLDSMVLGETEITGQLKHAYQTAHESKLTGRLLNRAFQTALQTAKEIRTNTQIGRGSVSIGSVAVDLADKIFGGDLSDKTVMIIGAGKMGEACVRHLSKKGARSILVSNRSFDRAETLANEFGGRAIRFDGCLDAMTEADIVVSSTGCPQTVLHREEIDRVMSARRHRPLFLIDIAVPRDIDPDVQHLDNVYLYNIDHLEKLVRENLRLREAELERCREIIEEKATTLMSRISPTEKPRRELHVGSQNDWSFQGAALCAS
jgi:glutamyl-tRNA reductase